MTYLHLKKPSGLAYIVKSRPCGYAINLILNDSTGRTRERARVSKDYQNILRCVHRVCVVRLLLTVRIQIGTIVSEKTPFNTASSDNLTKAQRKRTLVDELVDDAEAKSYAKKKFKELQSVRGARGRGTLAQRQAKRKPKW